MPAPKKPNTVAATAAVQYGGQETMAVKLRAAGWMVEPPIHYRFGMHDTACGLKPGKVKTATADPAKTTCRACLDKGPL